MNLRLQTNIKYSDYINLVEKVYAKDKKFKNNCEEIIKDLFENKGAFCENSEVISMNAISV